MTQNICSYPIPQKYSVTRLVVILIRYIYTIHTLTYCEYGSNGLWWTVVMQNAVDQPPKFVGKWVGAYTINVFVVVWVLVVGFGFGGWASVTNFVRQIDTFGLFTKCYQCPPPLPPHHLLNATVAPPPLRHPHPNPLNRSPWFVHVHRSSTSADQLPKNSRPWSCYVIASFA